MTTNIAFFGLGNMGLPMALNLVRAGYTVCGDDQRPRNIDALVAGSGKPLD